MSFAANPRAKEPNPSEVPQEPTGAVASDSLAAESLQCGGGFADNENASALGVKGANSTLNTTDTSGASALHPASSGAAREEQDAMGLGSDEKGSSGLKYPEAAGQPQFEGRHTLQGYAGGPSDEPTSSTTGDFSGRSGVTGDSFADGGAGISSGSSADVSGISSSGSGPDPTDSSSSGAALSSTGASEGTGVRPYTDTAPSYAANVSGAIQPEGSQKPKGNNLTEGGIPETKTFTGNVGGQYDPGRLAEQDFQKLNATDMVASGTVKDRQETGTGSGAFDVLSSESAPDRNY